MTGFNAKDHNSILPWSNEFGQDSGSGSITAYCHEIGFGHEN